MISTTFGWLGSVLLAFCGLPELFVTLKTKQCKLSWPFLLMWGLGEVFTLIAIVDQKMSAFLLLNYSLNMVIIFILIYFKSKKRGDDVTFIH